MSINRVLLVTSHLPFSLVREEGEERLQKKEVIPGDVDFFGLKEMGMGIEFLFFGFSGVHTQHQSENLRLTRLFAEKDCIPFFTEKNIQKDCNEYCSKILWRFFHGLGLPEELSVDATDAYVALLKSYKLANKMYADVILEYYKEGDVVWCHGHQFIFLAEFLKKKNNSIKVMWFLHTPIPSESMLTRLPPACLFYQAIIEADIVGLRTPDHVSRFVMACEDLLTINHKERLTRVDTFDIGIDLDRFIQALKLPDVQNEIKGFRTCFENKKVILSVDILDTVPGFSFKMSAFKEFCAKNPSWQENVILVQIAVPPQQDNMHLGMPDIIVGSVFTYTSQQSPFPLMHREPCLKFHHLCALYAIADVAMVTPVNEEMSLIGHEFVACQASKNGVLILSKYAADVNKFDGALRVNPLDKEETASVLGKALNMVSPERKRRHELNYKYVTSRTAQVWARTCLSAIDTRRANKDGASSTSTST